MEVRLHVRTSISFISQHKIIALFDATKSITHTFSALLSIFKVIIPDNDGDLDYRNTSMS